MSATGACNLLRQYSVCGCVCVSYAARSDFASLPRNATFASGSTLAWVYVQIYDDTVMENTERFNAILSTSEPNVALGGNIIVNILDNDGMIY